REIIVLLGENGTEKTTFLNLITVGLVAANGGVEVFRLKVNESGKDKFKQKEKAALIEKERIEKEKIENEKETERIKREKETERKGLQPILNLKTVRQLLSQIIDRNNIFYIKYPLFLRLFHIFLTEKFLIYQNNQTISKKDSN
ncbi:MAG: hypothetical protein EZS28_051372, partial [Streblomastix strix]